MEQFSLEKWLQDKSRRICTRYGRPVRIVCWDKLDDRPAAKEQKIVALVKEGCKENVFMYNNNGDGCISALDLFFADEEEELTEFEKEILNLLNCATPEGHGAPTIEKTKEYSQKLIDLARKKILKDLPKLEKTEGVTDPTIPVMYTNAASMKSYVEYNGYKVCINELFESLPKEE